MRTFPIIPVFWMSIICIILLGLCIYRKRYLTIGIIILLFIINLRIMVPNGTEKTMSSNVDVMFVIDSTISMNAEDYNGEQKRLDGVKQDCKKIIEELNGARFSLITFNNDAKIMIPFTQDSTMTYEAIDIIEPIDDLYARGTSLNTPKDTMEQYLKQSYEKSPDKLRILFFISDGEITDESKLKSFSSIKKYISDGAVLGYGTTTGGYMRYVDKYSNNPQEEKYIMDYSNYNYSKAISRIDEKNLKKIANDIGINYIHMTKTSKINSKLNSIKNNMNYELTSSNKTNYEDIYYIFVIPLLLLLVIDYKHFRRDTK